MDQRKGSQVSEVSMPTKAHKVHKPNNPKGKLQMKTNQKINRQQDLSELSKMFEQSPLRFARYQFLKEYLQTRGIYQLSKTSEIEHSSWTRAQIEQAVEDVIRCGDGKIGPFCYKDGAFAVVWTEKDKQEKSTTKEKRSDLDTTSNAAQSGNRTEGGL